MGFFEDLIAVAGMLGGGNEQQKQPGLDPALTELLPNAVVRGEVGPMGSPSIGRPGPDWSRPQGNAAPQVSAPTPSYAASPRGFAPDLPQEQRFGNADNNWQFDNAQPLAPALMAMADPAAYGGPKLAYNSGNFGDLLNSIMGPMDRAMSDRSILQGTLTRNPDLVKMGDNGRPAVDWGNWAQQSLENNPMRAYPELMGNDVMRTIQYEGGNYRQEPTGLIAPTPAVEPATGGSSYRGGYSSGGYTPRVSTPTQRPATPTPPVTTPSGGTYGQGQSTPQVAGRNGLTITDANGNAAVQIGPGQPFTKHGDGSYSVTDVNGRRTFFDENGTVIAGTDVMGTGQIPGYQQTQLPPVATGPTQPAVPQTARPISPAGGPVTGREGGTGPGGGPQGTVSAPGNTVYDTPGTNSARAERVSQPFTGSDGQQWVIVTRYNGQVEAMPVRQARAEGHIR